MFGLFDSEDNQRYEIVEGTEGMWNYHLREEGDTRALCGAQTMLCGTATWGQESENVSSTYCEKCHQEAEPRLVP